MAKKKATKKKAAKKKAVLKKTATKKKAVGKKKTAKKKTGAKKKKAAPAAEAKAVLTMPDGTTHEMPVIIGTMGETGVDIATLRASTPGHVITVDPGYGNTGSCLSEITFIDGEQGELLYRGYPIEQLVEKCSFEQVAYLLMFGELPEKTQLASFKKLLQKYHRLSPEMAAVVSTFQSTTTHPMEFMSSMVSRIPEFYPEIRGDWMEGVAALISFSSALAAHLHRHRTNEQSSFNHPRTSWDYGQNFLLQMFGHSAVGRDEIKKAMNALLILHADHEQNCSTSTVRIVGSSGADLTDSIAAGISALLGPLHGGANQAVLMMLELIEADGGDFGKYVEKAKDPEDEFRLMGFGHRVYKNFDPRANILRAMCPQVLKVLGVEDPLLEIAKGLEQVALEDDYFITRKLYPNVDFYSGIIYRALGIPTDMFTVMFTLGRMPGWIAHWHELRSNGGRINRPRQIYTGPARRDVP